MEHGKHTDAEQYKFGQRIPLAQKWFMLDPSNVAITSMALGIGVAGAAVIEVLWWSRVRLWANDAACEDSH